MKKILIILTVVMPYLEAQNSIQEGVARLNRQRLSNIVQWLKDSDSETQILLGLIMYKLDKLEAQVDSLQEQLSEKLAPAMIKEFGMLKSKISAQIEKIKVMTPEVTKTWRENLKFKLDQLPQDIMFLRNKVKDVIPDSAVEQFNKLQEKARGIVEWLRTLPVTDKEAAQQVLRERVQTLQDRLQVLNRLGRKLKYQEIKEKIDDFLKSTKEWSRDVKNKVIDLYNKAIDALGSATKTSEEQ
jgi:hypothetical protein